ncbi:hypothetical protein BKA66DRAFT_554916 [Pyrenochaeta sp. MPI-SDFR-AT-0127]|nr:hypothetical protein BKA66DRAFT_554916 [Pyrenochaeta sp. MPI-SDFR-AT-0127]
MFAGRSIDVPVNPQLQSKFFAAPAEIRFAIYAYLIPRRIHLSFKKGFRPLPCVQRDEDGDANCLVRKTNNDCFTTKPCVSDPIFLRRLRSSWGSHWRCEEQHPWQFDNLAMPLFRVCKRTLNDFVEAMVDIAAIQIDDVDTLGFFIPNPISDILESDRPSMSMLWRSALLNVKVLSISLRLPLAVFKALEDTGTPTVEPSFTSVWMKLALAIERFRKLRTLHVWLDHDEPCSWSMANERAVLSPLANLNANLEVSIELPKLHPKWEIPDRHFTEDSAQFPLTIRRIYRQRYHVTEHSDGSVSIDHKPDFPITYELTGWDVTIEELEASETRAWKRGEHPFQDLLDLEPTGHPW